MTTREDIEQDIWNQGTVTRQHLFAFLQLIPTSDGQQVAVLVKTWLNRLHSDPHFSNVTFPGSAIDRVISDLESYGRVTHETVIGAEPGIMERDNG